MAQSYYSNNITDFSLGRSVSVLQLAVVHEPDSVATGDGTGPYVACLMELQAVGASQGVDLGSYGRLRTVATYTDGSTEELTASSSPFSDYGSVPFSTSQWGVIRDDGGVHGESPAPSASSSFSSSSTASARERLLLSTTKTIQRVTFKWTASS